MGDEQSGLRLDVWLSAQPDVPTRSVAKSLIQAGQVLVDGVVGKPGLALVAGQEIVYRPDLDAPVPGGGEDPAEDAAAAPRGFEVLFEDDAILVIDKPAGISVHPGDKRGPHPTISELASVDRPDLPCIGGPDRPGIVHRLDKDTSGVMVLAKTEAAYHALKGQFKERLVRKEYRAIAFGEARFDSDHIDRAIARHPRMGDRMVVVDEGGREAQTYYEVVERFAGFTHFRCLPRTGRTHQIRVHLMSIGHSLVGDRLYRSRKAQHRALPEAAPDPHRHCLHAHVLTFAHPVLQEPVTFTAPLPADMEKLLKHLRRD